MVVQDHWNRQAEKIYLSAKPGIKNIRERAKSYTQKLEKRIMDRQMRTNPASTSTKLEKKYW